MTTKSLIHSMNQAPVLGGVGLSMTYASQVPQLLSPIATVTDADSSNFEGGQLVLALTQNWQPGDLLYVLGDADVTRTATSLSVNGVQIATYSGGGATALTIMFNAQATAERVQQLLRRLVFQSGTTSSLPRTVQYTLTDGDGGTALTTKSLIHSVN